MDSTTFLRAEDVATLLRISRAQAYRLIKRGAIPGVVRIGTSVRVRAATLDEWLRRKEEEQAA